MKEKENDIKDLSIDSEQIQETLKKISDILNSLGKIILDSFRELWDGTNWDMILQYKKVYEQSQWKYIKKGKRYVKVRRHNSEDIGRAFSRKIQHYKK